MRVGGDLAQRVLLRARAGERGEPGPDAAVGRVASGPPVYGSRRLAALLRREGRAVNRKRVARLLELMGVEAAYPSAA